MGDVLAIAMHELVQIENALVEGLLGWQRMLLENARKVIVDALTKYNTEGSTIELAREVIRAAAHAAAQLKALVPVVPALVRKQ